MILIQTILILAFLVLLLSFLRRQNSHQLSAWSKIFMVIFAILAVFVVLFPNSSNSVAHFLGVTRGADLLLYVLTLAFLFVVLNSYVNRKRDQQRLVALTRKVALLEAEVRKKSDSKKATGK